MATTNGAAVRQAQAPTGRIDMRTVQQRQADQTAAFKARSEKAHEQTEKLQGIRSQWEQALAKGDVDTLKILNANFESVRRESAANSKDLSQMMFALLDGYKDIGVVLKNVEELNPAEAKIVSDAEALHERAKGDLVKAQAAQFNIFGIRDRAIAKAQQDIHTAEEAVTMAKQQAEAMRRERINKMDLSQSMQLQQSITQELTQIAQDRIAEIEANLTAVKENVTATMDELNTDTKALEDQDAKLKQANAELGTLNDELASYQANSSEWQECRTRILNKTRERDDIEADRNATFMKTQEGERFIEFNKMEEQGQIQLLAQHKTWITLLQMGAKQRDVLYEVHLGLVQGSADQEAMSMIDKVGVETDERMATDAAARSQAMRDNTINRMRAIPERVRRLRQITGAENENQAKFEQDFAEAITEFQNNFGTAPGYDDRGSYRTNTPPAQPSA